jgi:hypothetical protein
LRDCSVNSPHTSPALFTTRSYENSGLLGSLRLWQHGSRFWSRYQFPYLTVGSSEARARAAIQKASLSRRGGMARCYGRRQEINARVLMHCIPVVSQGEHYGSVHRGIRSCLLADR